jgi:NAD(P) transhydrogenase subunit alpha
MAVNVAVVRETSSNERRVALTPEVAKKLKGKGATVLIQSGAGQSASFPDAAYKDAEPVADAAATLARADVLLKVQPPTLEEIAQLREGSVVVSLLQPHLAPERTRALRDRKITAFAMELLPRTTRAQAMDVLSYADHGRRHDTSVEGADRRRRRCRPAGHRDGAAPRRAGRGFRRAA